MNANHSPNEAKKRVYWSLWVFTIFVLAACVAGYTVGKDLAFRDNARDAAKEAAQNVKAGK